MVSEREKNEEETQKFRFQPVIPPQLPEFWIE